MEMGEKESHAFFLFDDIRVRTIYDIPYTPPNLNSKYVLSVDLHMKIQKKKKKDYVPLGNHNIRGSSFILVIHRKLNKDR